MTMFIACATQTPGMGLLSKRFPRVWEEQETKALPALPSCQGARHTQSSASRGFRER